MGRRMRDITGETSDGYHTFNELYAHRIALFLAFCAQAATHWPELVWRSKLHSDGSSYDGWFVLGIGIERGEQITYHLPMSEWEAAADFSVERERAPEFDGHTAADVLDRLKRWQ